MTEGWSETTLGLVADYQNGYPFKPSELTGRGLPVVRIKQLLDPLAEADLSDVAVGTRHLIGDGDLIFSWSGTLASRIWSRGPALLNQHLFRVSERPGVQRGWLHLALDHAIEALMVKSHGTTMKHVTKKVLEGHPVRLPPVSVQRRIVDLIGALDAQIEAMRKEEQAVRQVLSATRRDLLAPGTDWADHNLADVAEVRLGRMLSKERSTGLELHPYIRNANVQWAGVNLSDLKQMSFPEKERETYALKAGDILVCEGGDPGRAVLLREDLPGVYYQKAIHRVRSTQVDPGFLYHWLAQSYVTDAISDLCTNTTIKHLTAEKFRTLSVLVPPTEQQTLIVNLLDGIVEMQVQLTAEVKALRGLRTVLLASLLSGHTEIPDSYDDLLFEAV